MAKSKAGNSGEPEATTPALRTTVTAKVGKEGKPVTCDWSCGNNLEEMQERYEDNIIFENARAQMVISVQDVIRRAINDDDVEDKDIQGLVDNWTPGAKRRGKSKLEKALGLLGELTDEEKAALYAEAQAAVEGAEA